MTQVMTQISPGAVRQVSTQSAPGTPSDFAEPPSAPAGRPPRRGRRPPCGWKGWKTGKEYQFRSEAVGIEPRRASCRWRVTVLALSIAGRVHSSTMATFPEAPL